MKKICSFESTIPAYLLVMLFTLVSFSGCDKANKDPVNNQYYENHNISACGIKDPLQNIDWLKAYCDSIKSIQNFSSVYIYLLKVINKDEYVFRISVPSQIKEGYSSLYFRNCIGDIVFHWETITPPGGPYEDFMLDKEVISELFHFVK